MTDDAKNRDSRFFTEVKLGSGDSCALTPTFVEDETGIKIAAPQRIVIEPDMVLPVCAAAKFASEVQDSLPAGFWFHVVAVVTDAAGRRLRANTLGDPSPIPGEYTPKPRPRRASQEKEEPKGPAPQADPEPDDSPPPVVLPPPADAPPAAGTRGIAHEISGGWITQYRNFDLLEVVPLPASPGTYHLFLTYAEFQSNVLTVELIPAVEGKR